MTIEEVYAYFPNASQLAKDLGVSRQAIKDWVYKGKIPYRKQYKIERLTKGELKAEALADYLINEANSKTKTRESMYDKDEKRILEMYKSGLRYQAINDALGYGTYNNLRYFIKQRYYD